LRAGTASAGAVLAGVLITTQSRVNASLAPRLGPHSAVPTGAVTFTVGLLALLATSVATGALRRGLRALRGRPRRPWWFAGGVGGACLVGSQAYTVPLAGVALVTVCIVAGQLAGGLAVDRVGLSPSGHHALTRARLGAALLAAVGLVVAAAGAGRGATVLVVLLSLGAGAAVAVQQAANGHVGVASGEPLLAGLSSFAGGFVLLGVSTAVLLAAGVVGPVHGPGWSHAWLLLGGLFGSSYLVLSALVVRRLGLFRLSLALTVGQLGAGVLYDAVIPTAEPLRGTTVAAVVLAVAAAAVSGLGHRAPSPASG